MAKKLEKKSFKRRKDKIRASVIKITTDENWENVLSSNVDLVMDYVEDMKKRKLKYGTICVMNSDLRIFFCWNYKENNNKDFFKLKKKDFRKFLGYGVYTLGWGKRRYENMKESIHLLCEYVLRDDFYKRNYPDFENFTNVRRIAKPIEGIFDEDIDLNTVIDTERILDVLVNEEEYEMACAVAICVASAMSPYEMEQLKMSDFSEKNLVCNGTFYKIDGIIMSKKKQEGGVTKYVIADYVQKYIDLWKDKRNYLGADIDDFFIYFDPLSETWKKRKRIAFFYRRLHKIAGISFEFKDFKYYTAKILIDKYGLSKRMVKNFLEWENNNLFSIGGDPSEIIECFLDPNKKYDDQDDDDYYELYDYEEDDYSENTVNNMLL